MGLTVYYPVGQSDVVIRGGDKRSAEGGFRAWTASALEQLRGGELHVDRPDQLAFPMASVVCDKLIAEDITPEFILFATDQDDESYRNTDTLHAAELVRAYVRHRFGQATTVAVQVVSGNPSDYGVMSEYFNSFVLARLDDTLEQEALLIVAPGTPAMTTGLTLAFSPVGGRVKAWYVSESRGVQELELLGHLERQRWLRALRELVDACDFSGAASVLGRSNVQDRSLLPVLQALENLGSFAVEDAASAFNASGVEGLSDVGDFIRELEHGSGEARMALLVANIRMRYERGQRMEALALASGFSEHIAKLTVEQKLGVSMDPAAGGSDAYPGALEKHPKLLSHLKRKAEKKGFNYKRPGGPVFGTILAFFERTGDDADGRVALARSVMVQFREIGQGSKASLSDVRNRTPYGHGFAGVTDDAITEALSGRVLNDVVAGFYEEYYGHPPFDVFECAKGRILRAVEQLS
ncbi:MAG: hypothetical protein HQ559_06870 [Lentisphaerae bacterium]|nr:hypothetical protein [Lentisphaerota bacterium]